MTKEQSMRAAMQIVYGGLFPTNIKLPTAEQVADIIQKECADNFTISYHGESVVIVAPDGTWAINQRLEVNPRWLDALRVFENRLASSLSCDSRSHDKDRDMRRIINQALAKLLDPLRDWSAKQIRS